MPFEKKHSPRRLEGAALSAPRRRQRAALHLSRSIFTERISAEKPAVSAAHFILLPLLGILLLTGCSSPYLYEWGKYDQWLYENYKNPKNDEELYVDLTALIERYESRTKPDTKPLAPGLYAEYGFLLMRRGEHARAIQYYNKEKALWPEAAFFMDSMIQVAQIAGESSRKTEEQP